MAFMAIMAFLNFIVILVLGYLKGSRLFRYFYEENSLYLKKVVPFVGNNDYDIRFSLAEPGVEVIFKVLR